MSTLGSSQKILITGAASGIGRRLAEMLTKDARFTGASLFLTDRDAEGLAFVAQELASTSIRIEVYPCDLTELSSIEKMVAAMVEQLGGIDALVSNAGGVRAGPLAELSEADFDLTMTLNLKSTWRIAKAAYPHMKARGGSIVATSSLAGGHAAAGLGAYSASKAGLSILLKQMAVEWGLNKIRCNTVSPGPTVTGITRDVYSDPEKRRQRTVATPMGRIGEPDDIANAILFLLDPASSQVSGIDILVDGGLAAAAVSASGIGTGNLTEN